MLVTLLVTCNEAVLSRTYKICLLLTVFVNAHIQKDLFGNISVNFKSTKFMWTCILITCHAFW